MIFFIALCKKKQYWMRKNNCCATWRNIGKKDVNNEQYVLQNIWLEVILSLRQHTNELMRKKQHVDTYVEVSMKSTGAPDCYDLKTMYWHLLWYCEMLTCDHGIIPQYKGKARYLGIDFKKGELKKIKLKKGPKFLGGAKQFSWHQKQSFEIIEAKHQTYFLIDSNFPDWNLPPLFCDQQKINL